MNATSLYVSTSRLVFQGDLEDSASWADLYRLIPYLRQSLSCTVCANLLIEPYTPTETNCQHHVCRSCKGGKKKLKPSCSWCKDYEKYVENVQLRILLQCYKKLCEYVANSSIYRRITGSNIPTVSGPNLIDLIHEGSGFKDEFKSSAGLSKTAYSVVVPSVYTSTSTQTLSLPVSCAPVMSEYYSTHVNSKESPQLTPVNNIQTIVENNCVDIQNSVDNDSLYSVMYGGCGNKLTIKREAADLKVEESEIDVGSIPIIEVSEKTVQNALHLQSARRRSKGGPVKTKPARSGTRGVPGGGNGQTKIGCRCGNATATPGKLTCCGQRCPCYIESKACLECKCRGCRNPHTSDGHKIRPMIPELQNYQLQLNNASTLEPNLTAIPLTTQCIPISGADSISILPANSATVQVVGMYTTQLHNVSPATASILLDGNSVVTTDHDTNELTLEI